MVMLYHVSSNVSVAGSNAGGAAGSSSHGAAGNSAGVAADDGAGGAAGGIAHDDGVAGANAPRSIRTAIQLKGSGVPAVNEQVYLETNIPELSEIRGLEKRLVNGPRRQEKADLTIRTLCAEPQPHKSFPLR